VEDTKEKLTNFWCFICSIIVHLCGASLPGTRLKNNAMRSPVLVFLLLGLLSASAARSQSDELMIQGQTGNLYLVHSVAAKENWFSIGRMYNAAPKTITAFNHLTPAKPLDIGQQLQIPLTVQNFSQNGQKTAGETLIPVYHVIQEKEWMYRISVNHNKVPIPSLEKWNHVDKDQVKAGMHLVVGFLKVKTALSALAKPHETPAGGEVVLATPVPSIPAPGNAVPPPPDAVTETKNVDKSAADKPAVDKPTDNKPIIGKPAETKSTESKPIISKPVVTTPTVPLNFKGGFFRSDFTDAGRTATGMAGVFKSTSGWQDGKYYALMNNVPVGTIVKVMVAATSKSVYAKVLGQLPDMKESAGLTIRISNAAASELGAGDGKFNVETKF
jgi:hypothetical protein